MNHADFKEKQIQFLTHLKTERKVAAHTMRAYRADLSGLSIFWQSLSDEDKEHLTFRQIIERYLMSLYYTSMDKSTIARKHSCFNSFITFLKKFGLYVDLNLARPRVHKKAPSSLTIDEIATILDTVKDGDLSTRYPVRDKAMFELLYATGIRCAELVSIRLKDIDMTNKTIRIAGKRNKERIVLFGSKAKNKIKEYILKERLPFMSHDEYVFVNGYGKPFATRSIQRIIEAFKKVLPDQADLSPRALRHSFAQHLLKKGVDVHMVRDLLGSSSYSSTEKCPPISEHELTIMCNEQHPINTILKKMKQ